MRGYWKINLLNIGAGDGIRTRDPQLGKLMLYQLSYTRPGLANIPHLFKIILKEYV